MLPIVIKFCVLAMFGEFYSMGDMSKGCSLTRFVSLFRIDIPCSQHRGFKSRTPPSFGRCSDISHCLAPDVVSPLVVLVVVGSYIAFHLLDTSRLTVEVVADILAHSSDMDSVAAVEMIEM